MKPICQRVFDNPRLHVPVIFVVGLLIFFPLLGARDFWDHENEYAEITRVMLLDGNYMLPMFNGALWADLFILARSSDFLVGGGGQRMDRAAPFRFIGNGLDCGLLSFFEKTL